MISLPTNKLITNNILLSTLSFVSFFISYSTHSSNILQISSLLLALYILIRFSIRHHLIKLSQTSLATIDSLTLTLLVTLIIFQSGSLHSPFFFLVYFLLFGLSFLLATTTIVPYTLFLVFLLLITNRSTDPGFEIIQLVSILAVAPLANIFGKLHQQNILDKKRIKDLEHEEIKLENELSDLEGRLEALVSSDLQNPISQITHELKTLYSSQTLTQPERNSIFAIWNKLIIIFNKSKKLQNSQDE